MKNSRLLWDGSGACGAPDQAAGKLLVVQAPQLRPLLRKLSRRRQQPLQAGRIHVFMQSQQPEGSDVGRPASSPDRQAQG